ncbi:uncharacterized protein C8Q71DRAFT_774957 [Rhodofomes roseus]|uniref:S5 DRBM domain-containing protein n=1 Tax=Rhodofomes roseus TaxID=34475 RepID=A0A4Y9YUK3_9APHY|nr:uncharacterized protein C8Q71DRAFT_774957 [Rhodofomes roseus]KAH9833303.1 hypothetical protein C8Q71DRAFT_774957 [Rhodofomes roseus]TFY65241.1 hypothetical protein EVJ58_g2098 [Rhodofomes roseus]
MNAAKNALRAASTSRMAMKFAVRARTSTPAVRRYATDTSSGFASSPTDNDAEGETDGIPDRVHPDVPNLMDPDVRMDLVESHTFAPSRRTKFRNTVTIRNDEQNMFELLRKELGTESAARAEYTSVYNEVPMNHAIRNGKLYMFPVNVLMAIQQTGKGKIASQRIVMVAGNQNGFVGVGIGKSGVFLEALHKSVRNAVRNMDYIQRFEDRTIWTEMEHKFGSTRVIMRPRPVGFGLHCNPNVYHILKAAGIKDISVKVWGSRNPLQVVNTVMQMLMPGRDPVGMGDGIGGPGKRTSKPMGMRTKDEIELARGRKLVPLR